ncbi:MAG: ParB/RepB/Spo0J family partition protein [Ruminococcus sp.]|jgi:ParB family chromosome partitioning protein|nr:ParB/RepB/Spo0J family partition protein [Ruminococcus sp.]
MKKLGLGLDALFDDNSGSLRESSTLRISQIEPNKSQPRRFFDADAMQSLTLSIKDNGLLQPILVTPISDGHYRIVAGERRYRAAKSAGLTEIPVIIKELTDRQIAEAALVENLQREGLNPIEEAEGLKQLIDDFGLTQEAAAKIVGKSRPAVANLLRLLELSPEIKGFLIERRISPGQGKALLSVTDEKKRAELLYLCADGKMTVRETEKSAAKLSEPDIQIVHPLSPEKKKYQHITETELALRETLSRNISIKSKDGSSGKLTIEFDNEDDLKKIAKILENLK